MIELLTTIRNCFKSPGIVGVGTVCFTAEGRYGHFDLCKIDYSKLFRSKPISRLSLLSQLFPSRQQPNCTFVNRLPDS
jgi:hypothetical protein